MNDIETIELFAGVGGLRNGFEVLGFTKSLEGKTNGFSLRTLDRRGEKEIGLSEMKFFSNKAPRHKR